MNIQASAPEGFPVGTRVKAARQAQGLSQRELARRAHITNANLSMIEQNKVSPALSTLEKILHALSLNLADFFALTQTVSPIYKATDLLLVKRAGAEFRILPPTASTRYMAEATIHAHAGVDGLWVKGRGTVAGLIITGSIHLRLNDETYPLQAGDAFEFLLQRKHGFTNDSDLVATLFLCVDSKP